MRPKNNIKVYFLLSLFFFIYINYLFKINLSCWTYSFQHVLVKDHVNGMLHNSDFSLFGYPFLCVSMRGKFILGVILVGFSCLLFPDIKFQLFA